MGKKITFTLSLVGRLEILSVFDGNKFWELALIHESVVTASTAYQYKVLSEALVSVTSNISNLNNALI